jgi:hypothetical protein
VLFAPSIEIRKSTLLKDSLLNAMLNGLLESAW